MIQAQPSTTETRDENRLLDNPALMGPQRYLSQPHTPTPTEGPTSPGPDWGILEVSEGGSHCVGRGPRELEPREDVPHRDRRLGGRSWGRRGPIRGRTRASARKLRRTLAAINEKLHPKARIVFLTASYAGRECPTQPSTWAADLAKLRKKIERNEFGGMSTVWSREFTRKGRVHHHLLAFLPSGMNRDSFIRWVRRAWVAIVGDGGPAHRRRGLYAEKIKTWEAASRYLSKTPDAAHELRGPRGERLPTGKTWDLWGRKFLGITYRKYTIPAADWSKVRQKLREVAGHPLEPRPGRFADQYDTHHAIVNEAVMVAFLEALGIDTSHRGSPP